jgi:hypothetical protein
VTERSSWRATGAAAHVASAAAHLALAMLLLVLAPVGALADHSGSGGATGGAGPIGVALMWGGAAFVAGMVIVAVLARLTRRERPRDEQDQP